MRVFLTQFWLPKDGNNNEEYEDAFSPETSGERNESILRFAVADGASEGMLSGIWARILVKMYCTSLSEDLTTFLNTTYNSWEKWKNNYLLRREKQGGAMQWYEDSGLKDGEFSSLLGFTIRDSDKNGMGQWQTMAVGDSCLFQVRGEKLVVKFPIEHSSEFNNQPWLISSNPRKNKSLANTIREMKGDWCVDDSFYLMTDALASWFLKQHELEQAPWKILRDLDTLDQLKPFNEWISELRISKKIRNDDVTLMRIDMT